MNAPSSPWGETPGARTLLREQRVPKPLEELFPFFQDAANLERLTPPFLNFRILTPRPIHMNANTLIDYQIRLYGIPLRWRTRIQSWQPPHSFVDVQEKGPYALWHHTHTFLAIPGGTLMRDEVRFRMPFGLLGEAVYYAQVMDQLRTVFNYRQAVVAEIFGQWVLGQ